MKNYCHVNVKKLTAYNVVFLNKEYEASGFILTSSGIGLNACMHKK